MSTPAPRWLVERKTNDFEDVGANVVTVECGCLVFRTAGKIILIIAAGEWLTVCEAAS